MLTIRPAGERGHAEHGWLESWHSFAFADYFDPAHLGFSALRVINEDFVQPGQGFGTHPHRDMEILTWVLEGALQHQDSMGNGSVIRPGEIQYMSAGTGVTHSEFNASPSERVHLLQIWILPSVGGAPPRYGQKSFAAALAKGDLVPLATPDGQNGSIAIRQDARVLAARADGDRELVHALVPGRKAWIQVARGSLRVNDLALAAGDGLAAEGERKLSVQVADGAELLLFDLP
jgi:redox-sensitive bicupin YhaK (pirin superfamily)